MNNSKLLFLLAVLLASFPLHATFSIVATDSATGQVGGAGATCLDDNDIAGGILIISAMHPGKGVIHTQSYWDPNNQDYANTLMLDTGASPEEIVQLLTENDWTNTPELRQYLVADFDEEGNARAAGFTGDDCFDYKNHIVGPNYVIAGNILLNADVLTNMETAFLNTQGSLADKLMAALQGANIPGADSRCLDEGVSTRSAFIRVANSNDTDDNFYLNESVTLTPFGVEPIDVLQLQYDAWKFSQLCGPIVMGSPTTDGGIYSVTDSPVTADFSSQVFPFASEYCYLQHGEDYESSSLLFSQFSVNESHKDYLESWMQQLLLPKETVLKEDIINALGTEAFIYNYDDESAFEGEDWNTFNYCSYNKVQIPSSAIQLPGSPGFQQLDIAGTKAAISPMLTWMSKSAIPLARPEMESAWETLSIDLQNQAIYDPAFYPPHQGNRLFELATEIYWGFWENDPNGNGMAGDDELPFLTRAEINSLDWQGAGPGDLFDARFLFPLKIVDSFEGIFSLSVNEWSDISGHYTSFTQYCDKAQLSGSNNSGLVGNAEKNNLTGNEGHNSFEGGPEFDVIDGAAGMDTAIFSGSSLAYTKIQTESGWMVMDLQDDRDDSDELLNIEFLRFADGVFASDADLSTGIQTTDNSFSIYPNPCGKSEFIHIENTELIETLSIYQTNGSLIFKEEGIHHSKWIGQLSELETGLYYVVLQSTSGTQQISKLLIQ